MNTILRTSVLALAVVCPLSFGVQTDFNQKVVIESERQTIDMKTNVVTYQGDVKVSQGTLEIHAEQLQILNASTDGEQVLVASGSPARYSQTLDDGKTMKAEAENQVRYELVSRVLLLSGQARLMQQDSLVKGDRIRYNLEQQILEADSKQDGSERVTTIFIPEQIQQQLDKEKKELNQMALLQAQNLAKSYKGRQVVKDVSLQVEPGQIVGLLGPNGAGKTTTFYMVVGLVQSDKGTIVLNGEDLSLAPMHTRARKGIGYLPQESSIFRKLTVKQNIMAILEIRKDLTQAQREEILDDLLEEFHITHIADNKGMSLSGGERRRVEIARALAAEPSFILLDEPFAGVDPISVSDIKKIIEHLKARGLGILITDHNVRETLSVCEHAYIVSHGELIATGTPDEVLANQQVRDVYLGEQFQL